MQPFHYVTTKLEIGAQAPFRILHVTDTHIARADADDDSRKQALARQRAAAFEGEDPGCTERFFGKARPLPTKWGHFWFTRGICLILSPWPMTGLRRSF